MRMQAYPFVVRKVLRDAGTGGTGPGPLLRDIMYDGSGAAKPVRVSAVLNAALGRVAAAAEGFVDFDTVPNDSAPLQVNPSAM